MKATYTIYNDKTKETLTKVVTGENEITSCEILLDFLGARYDCVMEE